MKNCILFLLGGLLFLSSCQPKEEIEVQTSKRADSTAYVKANIVQSVFTSANSEIRKSCDMLNAKVSYLIDSIEKSLLLQADTFYTGLEQAGMERPVWDFEMYAEDSVFMASPDYISLRITVYTFQGGAHGMTEFYAFNYDVKRRQFLEPDQILDFGKYREINELLKKNFVNTDSCFTDVPTLENGLAALNVTAETVCLTYPPYVLGPYACGYAQVVIPRSELKGMLFLPAELH